VEIEFRDIKRQDIEELVKISSDIGGYNLRYENMSERVRDVTKSQNGTVIVAVEKSTLIGWIQIEICTSILTDKCCRISGLFVVSKYRGRKIGRMLVEKAGEWGINNSCTSMSILSDEKRIDSNNFYKHLGFKHIKTEETYYKKIDK